MVLRLVPYTDEEVTLDGDVVDVLVLWGSYVRTKSARSRRYE